MLNRGVLVALVCAVLAVPAPTRAQDNTSRTTPEVTAFGFLGSTASSGVGTAVRWPLPGPLSLEVETAYRRSAVAPFSANVNILLDMPTVGRVTPYVAGGIGLDQYAVADSSSGGPLVVKAGTALAVNAGGGLRVRSGERWSMRTDARWSKGLAARAPERWRVYNGVSFGQ